MSAEIELKKVYERDIDLLILEEFVADKTFAKLFLNKAGLGEEYKIIKAAHSFSDADGESDLTLVLKYAEKRVAILIEDKIDAQTMPQQSERYLKRAQSAQQRGEYDVAYVFLAAPEEYHEEHLNDTNAAYQYRVTYEEIAEYFRTVGTERAQFKAAVVEFAVREKKAGYQVQEDVRVTAFWKRLRIFCKENYPALVMLGEDGPKGSSAVWPEFCTALGNVKVVFKSQKGYVDLEFPRYGERAGTLREVLGDKMSEFMQIRQSGKSASVRIEKSAVDFHGDFAEQEDKIREAMDAVSQLCDLAGKIDRAELY